MTVYLLFSGQNYYPQGGAGDFVSTHESLEAARAAFDVDEAKRADKWGQVASFDGEKLEVEDDFGSWYVGPPRSGPAGSFTGWKSERPDVFPVPTSRPVQAWC